MNVSLPSLGVFLKGGWMIPAALLSLSLAGCETLAPTQGGTLSKDVVETKMLVQRMMEEQDKGRRTLDYRLETLEEKVQSRNELLDSNLSEIEKRMREQNEEIVTLKNELSQVSFQLDALVKQLAMKPATPTQTQETAQALNPTKTGESLYDDAYRQFNLGRYSEAQQGFEQAIAAGVSGDQAIQAQYYLAESLFRQNDYRASYDQYTKLIQSNPSHALAWQSLERLADIHQKQNRPADALRLYEKIVSTYPNYEGIERVKQQIETLRAQMPAGEGPAATPTESPVR